MKKKIIINFLVFIIAFMFVCPINAKEIQENDDVTLNFREFSYTTNEISSSSRIEYISDKYTERYEVYDSETNLLTDVFCVEYLAEEKEKTRNTYTAFFTYYKHIYSGSESIVNLKFTVCVTLFKEGSFRSFQSIHYTNLTIDDSISVMSLTNTSQAAWSHTGSFPCTRIDFAYSTTITCTLNVSFIIKQKLLNAGFSMGAYFYKSVNASGTFNLYQ